MAVATADKTGKPDISYRFFDQAFFQADAEIAGHDFYDVFGFYRRCAGK